MKTSIANIEKLRQFVSSNPAYIITSGDPNTEVHDIEQAVRGLCASLRKKGRNPVLVGVTDNAVSEVAATVAEEIRVPVMFGDPDTIVRDIDSRNLRKDHVQVLFFYTPEYAGSDEHLTLLYGCKRFNGTLRSWSNFHHQWMNCSRSARWVPEYNNHFLITLNSYSMSEEAKKEKFAYKIAYIRKYDSLYARKEKGNKRMVPQNANTTMDSYENHGGVKREPQKTPASPMPIPVPMSTVNGNYARVF